MARSSTSAALRSKLISRATIFIILIFNLLFKPSHSKTTTDTIKLTGEKTESTVFKFALGPNASGKFSTTIRTKIPYQNTQNLKVYFYKSQAVWNKVKVLPTCEQKTKLASFSKQIDLSPKKSKLGYEYEFQMTTSLFEKSPDKVEYWFVTIADCSLELYFHENEEASPHLHYAASMWTTNSNPNSNSKSDTKWNHVSYDQQYMKPYHLYSILFSLFLVLIIVNRISKIHSIQQEIHVGCIILFVATVIQLFSSLCAYIHYIIYESNGIGSFILDCLSAYFESIFDSIISILLIAISSGWTLPNDVIIRTSSKTRQSLRFSGVLFGAVKNKAVLVCILTIFGVHFGLAQWGRMYNEDFDCFHDLEHFAGKVLLGFRIFLGFFFCLGIGSILNSIQNFRLKNFFKWFGLLGFSWFITLPLVSLVIVSKVLHAHQRHFVVSSLALMLDEFCLLGLSWLFLFGWDTSSPKDESMSVASSNGNDNCSAFHKVSKIGKGRDTLDGMGGSSSLMKFGKTKIRLD